MCVVLQKFKMRQHAQFREDRSNRCRYTAIERFLAWRPSAILNFAQKFEILTIDRRKGSKCIIVPNFVPIRPTVAELWRFNDFSKWQPSASLDFKDWNM